ncbi:D-glycero-beta-D-manno-heptose-7-phosphate kinase [Buchnera aphidicola (Aphis craccivora)]|uniref:D-glycero-beta-D-manno-heptose-7-phosphate kinase n=1 Tax=Buchnera aphidicola (Aphis craccivora) TaxID=466616 RepID=A0A4D6XKX7_9GAMM|nr:D-glycero-beta-D-manno-heptose-7-phosphate kinase [Buchnera aphidicola]QCI16329.1 D-glycero-beta-D-manno-heptose-7-phosphate kinase [Buchnera aphidicola (Aphis craccivora)]QLL40473.1 D-glycero-beta-D-manno-heptose-7-phosphate kinase [Buchnera aphidicola (Aphis craccivore)]WAI17844.1 MAG: D-glycero-beta-D-manno-heptose-7-phosphate kinase [Buchnera aphidicola (Aphis craccivora)]
MKKEIIDFNNALVLVVGDLILDCYWYSKNYYMLSEQSMPVALIKKIKKQPGGAGNVAKNIAEIGGKCKIIGVIGEDSEGIILQKLLKHIKIYADLISIKNSKTITKIRVLSKQKQLIRLDFQEKYIFNNFNLLYKKILNSLKDYKVLVLSDYAKGTLFHIKKIINLAKKMSIHILIDPKGIDFKKYSGASLLTPNLSEFEKIVGKCNEEQQILTKGMKLVSELNLSALLVTRSKNGMTLFQSEKKPIHFPAISKTASDVTGAGDTVISIIASALATGYSLEESCFYANVGASIVIQKIGTETLNINELNTVLNM